MRILIHPYVLVPILLLSPITVLAHQTSRRTVNFVPPHPGAEFHTEALPIFYSRDPYRVAQAFLDKLGYPNGSYFIRKDSYTDENTGISHVYVRQVVNDLEVADANININIRDGQILSYGNSFFKGSENSSILPVPNWHQAVYCSEASMRPNDPACGSALDRVQAIASLHALDESGYHHDPRAAAFFFLQVAHPDPASLPSAFASLKAKYHECGNLLEQRASCDSWLVTGYSDKVEPIHVRQVYVQTPGTSESTDLNLAWRLETSLPENYYVAYVSVHDPSKIISMFDQVLDAPTLAGDGWLNALERYIFSQFQEALPSLGSMPYNHNTAPTGGKGADSPFPKAGTYHVWKWGINDPDSGNRTLEVPPIDRRASPIGWHSVPAGKDPLRTRPNLDKDTIVNYTSTVGNNIIAQENWAASSHEGWKTNNRPDGGPNLIFDFPQPYAKDPHEDPRQFSNNSITQLFYAANMYHDLLYLYGFDEISGNYQQYNFGKGGAEGDAIIIDAQIGQKYNNAFFTVTRDGQNGRCHMYLWDMSRPLRDGALDQGILIHELSHGLSSRLTGGRNNTECLRTNEAKAMGEGWGDFIATLVRSTSTYHDYPIGAWASNSEGGIRNFPYSTNITTNPSLYNRFLRWDYYGDDHKCGEIWAEILYVVSNKLIEKHGFADSLFPSSDSDFYRFIPRSDGSVSKVPNHGNTLMLQLIVNGMKTQPCNPTFIQARDAIIKADQELNGGDNKCVLWEGFASRGLGLDAKNITFISNPHINGFQVPPECN